MSANSDRWAVPNVKDELERKTLETVEWIAHMASTGQMSESEVKVATQTAFSIISGLASPSIQNTLQVLDASKTASATIRKVYFAAGSPRLFVVTWIVGESFYTVTGVSLTGDKASKSKEYTYEDAREALGNFAAMCQFIERNFSLSEI